MSSASQSIINIVDVTTPSSIWITNTECSENQHRATILIGRCGTIVYKYLASSLFVLFPFNAIPLRIILSEIDDNWIPSKIGDSTRSTLSNWTKLCILLGDAMSAVTIIAISLLSQYRRRPLPLSVLPYYHPSPVVDKPSLIITPWISVVLSISSCDAIISIYRGLFYQLESDEVTSLMWVMLNMEIGC